MQLYRHRQFAWRHIFKKSATFFTVYDQFHPYKSPHKTCDFLRTRLWCHLSCKFRVNSPIQAIVIGGTGLGTIHKGHPTYPGRWGLLKKPRKSEHHTDISNEILLSKNRTHGGGGGRSENPDFCWMSFMEKGPPVRGLRDSFKGFPCQEGIFQCCYFTYVIVL